MASDINTPKAIAAHHRELFGAANMTQPGWAVVPIISENMEPTLRRGDAVLVDTKITEYSGEGLYVLDNGGEPLVYRLMSSCQINKPEILLILDNKNYGPSEWVPREQANEIILGKVMALGVVVDRKLLEARV